MEINAEKIGMIKEIFNPKNKEVNLDIGWSVDCRKYWLKNIYLILKWGGSFIGLDFLEEFNHKNNF